MISPEHSKSYNNPPLEIERKFLVYSLPEDLFNFQYELIRQGYLAIENNGTEVRVRQQDNLYTLTVKSDGLLSRQELEINIDQNQFNTLWIGTESKRIEKKRYKYPYQEKNNNNWHKHFIELDIYDGELSGLVIAEIEFNNEDEAHNFVPPNWLDKEVTMIMSYKNKNLAVYGLPQNYK